MYDQYCGLSPGQLIATTALWNRFLVFEHQGSAEYCRLEL